MSIRRHLATRLAPAALALGLAAPAFAIDIYLNNVKVTGAVANQTFQDVSVRIAGNGDVYIDAPGYKVEVEQPEQAAAATGIAAGKYWFFLDARLPNLYKVGVTVNGKQAVEVPASSAQWVADLGPFLTVGTNQIQVTFLPNPGATQVVGAEAVSVLIGEGSKGADGTLTISKVLRTLKQEGGRSAEAFPLTIDLP
ncbi:MAG: hypothetical protein KC549_16160 [Myxococcales bacterium]|nr:hypothetical protein [Myxococcales bacterium]MCB9548256.1 hypothetical protein [Myxococcales bacterium]